MRAARGDAGSAPGGGQQRRSWCPASAAPRGPSSTPPAASGPQRRRSGAGRPGRPTAAAARAREVRRSALPPTASRACVPLGLIRMRSASNTAPAVRSGPHGRASSARCAAVDTTAAPGSQQGGTRKRARGAARTNRRNDQCQTPVPHSADRCFGQLKQVRNRKHGTHGLSRRRHVTIAAGKARQRNSSRSRTSAKHTSTWYALAERHGHDSATSHASFQNSATPVLACHHHAG